ncbi:MAG: calcium-transporting P-type ATPase, PMR1-type [Candidatus Bathyarchaeota archaeon]|nr:calcium-transporting P-type ATPase, PMR1-type [Candidatus Bathyarchaeota archaeon]
MHTQEVAYVKEDWHTIDSNKTIQVLQTNSKGLSTPEVKKRLEKHGFNELREEKGRSPFFIFFDQFKEFLMILLLVAVFISVLVGEIIDATMIFAIVIASAMLGFFQEYKAERSLEALKRMVTPKTHVLRNGEEAEIPAKEIVPGDILILKTGDKVSADGRLIEAMGLHLDEASLTGESVPVGKESKVVLDKKVPISERKNFVYTATTVTSGRGKVAVTSTGMNTEFGKIASMMQAVEEPPTPLQIRLSHVGKWLVAICLVIVTIVTIIGIIRGNPIYEMFFWGVALAVAAVPEALPAVVTGALAIGVQRMVRKNAIVRKLPAVETLGSTTVICSDKTGTLTRNEMTVRCVYVGDKEIEVTGFGFDPKGEFKINGNAINLDDNKDLIQLLKIGTLCNDASIKLDGGSKAIGDPTEIALLVAATKANLQKEDLDRKYPRIDEISFSSERKRMVTVHESGKNKLVNVKGAPEFVIKLCSSILKEGKHVRLTDEEKSKIIEINEAMARKGLRVLGMAFKDCRVPAGEVTPDDLEKDLVFVGLQGMIDTPREEAIGAIKVCKDAGIKVIMITGDHKLTAEAVAKELGFSVKKRSITGLELDEITDEELVRIVEDVEVYARTSPEHKIRIVKALQKKGHVVAVTGDGVNDAPALKNSDIGIAMGITGTEVTKEASDMILTDDNFASIVAAVEEGRGIYSNIKKYLTFLLSCNLGEILIVFVAGILGWPLPLLTIHLLWVNLATDGLPAIALGVDPTDPDIMQSPPISKSESIFTRRVKVFIASLAIIIALIILPVFAISLERMDIIYAQTVALTTLVMIEMFNALNCRSLKYSIFKIGLFTNKWLILAIASSIIMHLSILYIPGLSWLFKIRSLDLGFWALCLPLAALPLIIIEIAKYVENRLIDSNTINK